MKRLAIALLLPAVILPAVLASPAAHAGSAQVTFVDPDRYGDPGSPGDREANMRTLERHLQTLAQRLLPDAQVVKVEVLDLSLAGSERLLPRGGAVRIVRGRADWPRIKLRYTVEVDGQPMRGGEEWLTDLTYTRHLPSARQGSESLYYEKRLLEDWFQARLVQGRPAPAQR